MRKLSRELRLCFRVKTYALATTLAAAFVIFVGQLIVSQWWLRNFAYGPVECILRAITIGRVPRLSHQPL